MGCLGELSIDGRKKVLWEGYNEDSSQRAGLHYTGLFVPGVKWPGGSPESSEIIPWTFTQTNKTQSRIIRGDYRSFETSWINQELAATVLCVSRDKLMIFSLSNKNKTLFRQPATLNWVARLTLWLVSVVWPISAQISAASTGARADTCPAPRTCTVTAITRADTRGPRAGLQTRGDLADSIWSLRVKGQYWQ